MNLENARQRIRWITIAVLIGTAILLTVLDNTGNINTALAFIRNPMTLILNWTSAQTNTIADALAGPRDLQEAQTQIAELQAQLDALERENETLRELQGEYQTLLDLVNRARQTPDIRRATATVIGYDPSPAVRSLIIDKGSNDGIVVGMPVESARGLVGQVFRTTADSSQVVLISDNASAIPVRFGNSRDTGLMRGGAVGSAAAVEWVDLQYQLEVGEVVFTSGLGGKFPQNIPIGRVAEVDRNEAELFQRAIIQPAVDFDALEIVFVITDFQPIDTTIFESPTDN
ncbi:MAG: rod shape-determining protein MreC [Anaerolineales bacterium]|nr:rod shape-determining protein MreC [Anaerolineales bacterium]